MSSSIDWTEKYRPEVLDDVIGQDKKIEIMKSFLKDGDMPNMLLYGPAGVGKTSSAKAYLNEYYRKIGSAGMVLELNASEERGVSTVRKKIKNFISKASIYDNYYRYVVLDEVDYWPKLSQATLRRMMEDFHENARFILICNYPSKLIKAIVSRCTSLHFKHLEKTDLKSLLVSISIQEDMDIPDKEMDKIIEYSLGDVRKAINMLRSLKNNPEIKVSDLVESSGVGSIVKIINNVISGNLISAVKLGIRIIDDVGIRNFCSYIFDVMIKIEEIDDKAKFRFIKEELYDVDKNSENVTPKIAVVKLIVGLDSLMSGKGDLY